MSSSSRTTRREGPDPPPTRPTLAMSHPELGSLGGEIIEKIMELTDQGRQGVGFAFDALPELFDKVVDFVERALTTRGPNDSVAYWAEQTFDIVRRLEKRPLPSQSPALSTATTAAKPIRTWAAVASGPSPPTEEEVALRQVKVRVDDPRERTALWTIANHTILEKVAAKEGEVGVVGVRKLPSGDMIIQLKDRDGKQALASRKRWLEEVSPSARIIPDLYPVMVHGVRISRVNTTNQKEAIHLLESQNSKLHTGLRIVRVAWPRGISKTGKEYSSLTVFLSSPEAANAVITRGFVEGGEVKPVERFLTGCGLVQCFKCCSYGHIAKNCRAKARCGHCSESHETRECTQKDRKSCATCKAFGYKKTDHKAWDEICTIRVTAREKLRTRLETRSYLYAVTVDPDRRPLARPAQKPKVGRPRIGTRVVEDKEASQDPMDVDASRENKRKRQSTLSFPMVEMETDTLEQLQS
jgi:hypothetical protein